MRQITYNITRYNEGRSYVQSFTFDYEPDRTILWGLQKIKDTQDPTLTFLAACRSAVCGACSVRVNGQAMLGCEAKIDEVTERFHSDTIDIAPIGNFRVIRDLVVDWEAKVNRLRTVAPWIYMKAEFAKGNVRQTPADFKKFVAGTECILCGCCASECNKLTANEDDFLEPYVFTKANRFVLDSRDEAPFAHINPALAHGLWKCVHCMNCISRCPKHLKPAHDISNMRREATKDGSFGTGIDQKGPRHALAFKDDLKKTGRLKEVSMSLKSDGIVDSSKQMFYALRLMKHAKINPLELIVPQQPVNGIDGVRKLIKMAEEASK